MNEELKESAAYVALLRGINVGGKNMLPMRELAALFTAAGCRDVKTYIQSGNVVYKASPEVAGTLPGVITEAILQRFGLRVPVVTRTAAALQAVVAGNSFLAAGGDPETLFVAFLADAPAVERVAQLDPQRSPPDQFVVLGKEIYLCFPHGVGRTKLSNAYFDGKLATVSTVRNWRTVLRLVELSAG